MSDLLRLTLAALATILATGVGALPVLALGPDRVGRVRAALSGFAGAAMLVAAVLGLIVPALDRGSLPAIAVAALAGVGLLAALHRHFADGHDDRGWLVVAILLFVHSFPEGFAIGAAVGSGETALGVFVVLAIAIQNVPEGTATAMPMQDAGYSGLAQFGAAIATSLPQLPGALLAFALVEAIQPILPASFGFAAGAMIALTVTDLAPDALVRDHRRQGLAGALIGGVAMVALARIAGV